MKKMSEIAEILYYEDPMDTGCYEFETLDEYNDIAELIVFHNKTIEEAFNWCFGPNCLTPEQLTKITNLLE